MTKKIQLIILLLLFSIATMAQKNTYLNNFNAFYANGTVILYWEMAGGSTCDGIEIMRSTDSLYFDKIGEIEGICGSFSSAMSYKFTDENPVDNKINFYRLNLGNLGYSEVVTVEIIKVEKEGYSIRPHPLSSEAKIYFENSSFKEHQIFIFTSSGQKVYDAMTSQNYFSITRGELTSGFYLFTISSQGNATLIKGKLIIN